MTTKKSAERSQGFSNDEIECIAAEMIRNGERIHWEYWATLRTIDSVQGARLAHCIDPIMWPGDQFAQGPIPKDLHWKIERCRRWLKQYRMPASLGNLVLWLGEYAPYTMRQGAAPELAKIQAEHQEIAAQEENRRAAGRYTLEEAATELAEKSGWDVGRWQAIITKAVHAGHLSLRNPHDYTDLLPYDVPAPLRAFYDQLEIAGANQWLGTHPEWGGARLGDMGVINDSSARIDLTRTFTSKTARSTIIDRPIEMAQGSARDPDNYQQVWAELVRLAQSKERPPPLTGYSESEGVLYESVDNPCKILTKGALRKRIQRKK